MDELNEEATLFIRHLPAVLSAEEKADLLKHFGASSVSCMPDKGKLKYTAFARFPSATKAKEVLQRLHQLEVLGSRLVVEFAKEQHSKHLPSLLKDNKIAADEAEKPKQVIDSVDFDKTSSEAVNSLLNKWGLIYPNNPRLHYSYPLPNVAILTNIANALASVPKFYVQVLHLMNKMNLPPPFGQVTPSPPLVEGKLGTETSNAEKKDQATNTHEQDFMEIDSDESEIMSDDDTNYQLISVPVKRPHRQSKQANKKPRLQQLIQAPLLATPKPTAAPAPDEVFEKVAVAETVKHIEFRLGAEVPAASSASLTQPETATQPPLPQEPPPPEPGGFGKLEPVARLDTDDHSDDNQQEEFGDGEFISSSQLRKSRLSSSQLRDFSVFKNYSAGEPSSRLYIKNLAKQTTEKDLHYVFGRYVNWDDEQEKLMFDIRLMKEGRMKGQAFVTLPSPAVAKKAVKDTNAFVLHTKPMVVQFARSAKLKEDTQPPP